MAFEKEFENLFRSFAELRQQQAKTDEQMKNTEALLAENAIQQAKTDEQMRKTDEQMRKTDEQMKQTDERLSAKIEKLSKELGNIGNNNGEVAEEFFWNALREVKEFKGIKVDYSDRNIHRKRGNLNDEFDILLWNGNSVIIVETKYKVHPSLIEKIKEKKIPNFKKLFSDKTDHKIYYAIAGFVIPEGVLEDAKREGFFVIRQFADSENIIIENSEVKSF